MDKTTRDELIRAGMGQIPLDGIERALEHGRGAPFLLDGGIKGRVGGEVLY